MHAAIPARTPQFGTSWADRSPEVQHYDRQVNYCDPRIEFFDSNLAKSLSVCDEKTALP